jgi:flagellar protein FlaF
MKNAAQVYGDVAKQISNPREFEASLLIDAATRLQTATESPQTNSANLSAALHNNRMLWTLLLTTVTKSENPLPANIRQNVANLGLFVVKQTMAAIANPKPEGVSPLIDINRQVAAGLLGRT